MMTKSLMKVKILLPYSIFTDQSNVTRIVADTSAGSIGILPHRLDCVAALTPGIFIYQIGEADEMYIAIDQGILIKTGYEVLVSVRNAIGGSNLEQLQETVEKEFMILNEHEQNVRSVLAKMESAFIHRISVINHETV